jgi:hypothetical protein
MSDCCLMPTQQFFSYIMARTSQFSVRWWWGLLIDSCNIRIKNAFWQSFNIPYRYILLYMRYHTFSMSRNRISGVMVSVLDSNVVDHVFEPQSGKTKDYDHLGRFDCIMKVQLTYRYLNCHFSPLQTVFYVTKLNNVVYYKHRILCKICGKYYSLEWC